MDERFVSTGNLPSRDAVQRFVDGTYAEFLDLSEGANSAVYPALVRADPSQFGICLLATSGQRWTAGDVAVSFPIMSVSKPFVFALLCREHGPEAAARLIGVNSTGRPFDAVEAILLSPGGRTNPMVNPGAIAASSHLGSGTAASRWQYLLTGLQEFAGRPLRVDEETYASASASNLRNRVLAAAIAERGLLGCDPEVALDLYTRQCCLQVSTEDLAVMGATLADGGTNPVTGEQVVPADVCQAVLAIMATAGMYEDSGTWLFNVGLPAKSGISGGLVAVSPGKGGIAAYSPRLDAAGNSVRGARSITALSRALGLNVFASDAVTRS